MKKNLDVYVLFCEFFYDFLFLKNDVNVILKMNMLRNLVKGTDSRIRILTEMSRIRNTPVAANQNTEIFANLLD